MNYAQAEALNGAIRALALRHRARASVLLARVGLYPGQEWVLLELAAHGPMIQAKLAEAIACEPPSVTLMVRKLEAAGYIERRPLPCDRRALVVALTDRGRDLVDQLRLLWQGLAEDTIGSDPGLPLPDVIGLLNRLAANLQRESSPASQPPG